MTTSTINFISSIKAASLLCPIYDFTDNQNGNRKCYFELGTASAWDSKLAKTPVAIAMGTTFEVALAADALLKTLQAPLILTAAVMTTPTDPTMVFKIPLAKDADTLTTGMKTLSLVEPTAGGHSKPLPWSFSGDVLWTLNGSQASDPIYTCTTPLEIYVLPKNIPRYLNSSGIPLALLRDQRYLPAWMNFDSGAAPGPLAWPKFVVNAMFEDPRLTYENYSGSSAYVSCYNFVQRFTRDEGIDCWLDLWLSDIAGLTLKGSITHQLNCYDLAALTQVIVSLGVDALTAGLRMRYMKPFGYLKACRLIGRKEAPRSDDVNGKNKDNPNNLCNNPFYGSPGYASAMMWTNKFSWDDRSSFNNHMFLTIWDGSNTVVLDSCAGPQTGDIKYLDYPTQAIDEDMYKAYPTEKLDPKGNLNKITAGIGVERIVSSRCFERAGMSGTGSSPSLLDKIAAEMKDQGDWSQFYLTTPFTNNRMTATWQYEPKPPPIGPQGPQDLVTVNIFRYLDLREVQREWERRKAGMEKGSYISSDYNLEADFGSNGSIRMYYDTAFYYFIIIQSALKAASSTKTMLDKLKGLLNEALRAGKDAIEYIESMTLTPPDAAISVGDYFTATIKPTAVGNRYFRGFRVDVSRPNAVFLDCTETATGFDFRFLARDAGDVSIIISIYGGNLEYEQRLVNKQILAKAVPPNTTESGATAVVPP